MASETKRGKSKPISGPMTIADLWRKMQSLPLGKQAFSKLLGVRIPYSGSIGAEIVELADGHAVVKLGDRRAVRNHLNSIHAIALMNLGELATGLAVFHKLDGSAKGIITELRMTYAKKARGTITARCDVTFPELTGKHDLLVEGALTDEKGDEVARVYATWKIQAGD